MAFAAQEALLGVLIRLQDDSNIKIEELTPEVKHKDNRRSKLTPEERLERRL